MNSVCRLTFLLPLAVLAAVAPVTGAEKKAAAAPKGGVVNRIAATVNGRPVTAAEVTARLSPYFRELMVLYPKQGPRFNAELVKAKKEVLKDLIERELVLSEFENKGYVMKEDAVEAEINRRVLVHFNGNREEFLKELRRSGMTYADFRDSVRKEVTVSSMRASRYERGIPPTPDEIRAEYAASKSEYRDFLKDAISFDKIFIPAADPENPAATPDEQYKLAEGLRAKLDKGEISFAEAARTFSRDSHAEDGGVWPKMQRTELAVDFANVVFAAKTNQLIGPLLDPHGFTLVRVRAKHLAPAPPLSNPEVKQRVDDAVRRKQSEKRYREWVDRLRAKAVIRTFI